MRLTGPLSNDFDSPRMPQFACSRLHGLYAVSRASFDEYRDLRQPAQLERTSCQFATVEGHLSRDSDHATWDATYDNLQFGHAAESEP
jgi:hypothetical protein